MGRRGSPSPPRSSAMPARRMATRPVVAPPPPVMQQQQPSMLKQVAATAAGVAVGSAVGHAVGNALTSGGGSGGAVPEPAYAQQPTAPAGQNQTQNYDPCQYQIDQLVSCSQLNSDISQCQAIANALKDCRRMYNLQ